MGGHQMMVNHHTMYYSGLLVVGLLSGALAVTCPPGWVAPSDGDGLRCFRFETSGQNWYAARRMCRSASGELVSIRTQQEQNWLHEEVLKFTKKTQDPVWHWWAGLNAVNQPKDWSWSDGSVIDGSLIHWQPNEPDMVNSDEKCGELHRDGFNDNNCRTAFPYICARETDIPIGPCPFGEVMSNGACATFNPNPVPATTQAPQLTAGPEPVQGACAVGWVEAPEVSSLCFRFEKQAATWEEAKEVCHLAKGSLVSITSLAEKRWIEGQVRRLGNVDNSWLGMLGFRPTPLPSWWTGLRRLKIGFPWKWVDQTDGLASMLSWHDSEPNMIQWNKNCGRLHTSGLFSSVCEDSYPYICSRPKTYTPATEDCAFGHRSVAGQCVPYVYTHSPPVTTPTTPTTPTTTPTRPILGITAAPEPQKGTCPEGWVQSPTVSDRCYRFETTMKKPWGDAQKVCQSARGDLVTLRTRTEQEWVYGQVKRIRKSMWGGLHKSASSAWVWTDETPADNIWWQTGEPNNDFEKCGELHPRGMNDNSCWRKFGFICARSKALVPNAIQCPFGEVLMGRSCEPLQLPTQRPPSQGACAEGWVESPVTSSRCYRFVEDQKSFDDAKKMCRVAHGDLITVQNAAEKAWLTAQVTEFSSSKGKALWLVGLEKDGSNGWKWTDGSSLPPTAQTGTDSFSQVIGTNKYDNCVSVSPDGFFKTSCYSRNYICARPKVLPANTHACPWGQHWVETKCEQYQPVVFDAFAEKMKYIEQSRREQEEREASSTNNLDLTRIEDAMRRLEGRHGRELAALRDNFQDQITNLTQRVRLLERALHNRNRPMADFDAALTVVASNVPQTSTEDAKQVARRLLSKLGLPDVQIGHARRLGGSQEHPGHLKIEFTSAPDRQRVLTAKHQLRVVPGYENVRMRAAHVRRSHDTSSSK